MLKDYSGLEDSDDLNQQGRSNQADGVEKIAQGKFRRQKARVWFMSITEHKHRCMEWNCDISKAQRETATQLMKRSNCTLKTLPFHLQYLFTGITDCQNWQTCKMLVSTANSTGLYTAVFIFMLGRLSFETKISSLCFYFLLRNLGLSLLKRKSI